MAGAALVAAQHSRSRGLIVTASQDHGLAVVLTKVNPRLLECPRLHSSGRGLSDFSFPKIPGRGGRGWGLVQNGCARELTTTSAKARGAVLRGAVLAQGAARRGTPARAPCRAPVPLSCPAQQRPPKRPPARGDGGMMRREHRPPMTGRRIEEPARCSEQDTAACCSGTGRRGRCRAVAASLPARAYPLSLPPASGPHGPVGGRCGLCWARRPRSAAGQTANEGDATHHSRNEGDAPRRPSPLSMEASKSAGPGLPGSDVLPSNSAASMSANL